MISCQCYKTFFGCNLRIYVSVCYTRLEKFPKDKHSTLLRKSVIYVQKSFITLTTGILRIIENFNECLTMFKNNQILHYKISNRFFDSRVIYWIKHFYYGECHYAECRYAKCRGVCLIKYVVHQVFQH